MRTVPIPHIGSTTISPGFEYAVMACRAVCGHIFAGWARAERPYQSSRWTLGRRWPTAQSVEIAFSERFTVHLRRSGRGSGPTARRWCALGAGVLARPRG